MEMQIFRRHPHNSGFTLIEMIIVLSILSLLASAILPMSERTVQRTKEVELQRSLRLLRSAIDTYKEDFDRAVTLKKYIPEIGETGYPVELEKLLQASDWGGLYPTERKYLRRIPRDPFDKYEEGWGLRSYVDDPESRYWGGEDVYDVYSQSDSIGLNGTAYSSW